MSILSGFLKTKKYRKTSTGYKLQSEWTSGSSVEMADGNTAETNLGAIKGITDSLTATNSNVALSAKAGKLLQDQCTSLNTDLVGTLHKIVTPYASSIKKRGEIVEFNYELYHLAQSIDADRYTNICTIPQGFRPRHRICFYTPIVDATTGIWIRHAFCTINADGSVYLKTDDVSLNFCYINATYIAYN